MISLNVSVEGDKEIAARFRALEPKLQKRVLLKAVISVARKQHRAAKNLAPVLTGTLRRAGLEVRAPRKRIVGEIARQVQLAPRHKLNIPPTSKWYYPAIVIAGHRFAAPRPFIQKAYDQIVAGGTAELRDAVVKFIAKEGGGP